MAVIGESKPGCQNKTLAFNGQICASHTYHVDISTTCVLSCFHVCEMPFLSRTTVRDGVLPFFKETSGHFPAALVVTR